MPPFSDAQVSLFHGTTDAHPFRTTTLGAVLDAIRTGAYRTPIERLRHLRLAVGQAAYNAAKQHLDALTFGGTFAPKRSKTTLVQHSGLAHGDLDHLADVQATKALLCADASTAYCFISPGGDGLKLGAPIAPVTGDAGYKLVWQAVADYFLQHYGVRWDPSGKDICRLCFVSWDPDLYINPDAQLFLVPSGQAAASRPQPPPTPGFTMSRDRREYYAQQALRTAVKLIASGTPGNRHFWRCKTAYLLGGYVAGGILTAEEARTALEVVVARNTDNLSKAMRTIDACLAAGMQAVISLEELDQERRQWRATHWHARARTWTGQIQTVAAAEVPRWH